MHNCHEHYQTYTDGSARCTVCGNKVSLLEREMEAKARYMLVCKKALQLLQYFSVDSLNDRGPIQELSEEYAKRFPSVWQHPPLE